jgi:hypothetical protein
MGSQISTNQSETAQSQVSETINSIVTNVNNDLSSDASSKQTLKFKVGGNFKNSGKFNINQTSQVQMSAFVDNFQDTISELSSEIEANLDVDSIIENTMNQSGIILGQSQISVQSSRIRQDFENNLENRIETAVKNVINISTESENTIEFIVDGDFENTITGVFELNQSSAIESIAASISDSIVTSIVDSTIVNTASASTKMSTTMTQDGISEWALIIALLIPVVLVGGGGFMFALLLKLLFPLLLIIIGIVTLIQYRSAIYYTCENVSGTDNYINTELQEDGDPVVEDLYINPDFASIPSTSDFPEGFGDPETAYLIPSKQTEYDLLLQQLDEEDSDKSKIESDMSSISENKSNWMCVNGSDPINDNTKSDKNILFFIPAKYWSIWYSISMIIIGILISLYLILSHKSSQVTTSNISEDIPETQGGKKSNYIKDIKKIFKKIF